MEMTTEKKLTLDNAIEVVNLLPKTEIHIHLEGIAGTDSIWELGRKNNLKFKFSTKDELRQTFAVHDLNHFVDVFINVVQACFVNDYDMEYLFNDAIKYFKRNNIVYSEIFFSPTRFMQNGIPFVDILEQLSKGKKRLASAGIETAFILDVSRSFGVDNAKRNLDLLLKNPCDAIIGIGLGGAEQKGTAQDFVDIFERAIDNGYHVVAHAGEDVGPKSVWDTINMLHAERVGHGISSIEDENLIKTLQERGIPLEICPTSNLITKKYARTLQEHPMRKFFDAGIAVTINTDDPAIFDSELNHEYELLMSNNIFSFHEIITLIRNGIQATFLPQARQNDLWQQTSSVLKGLLNI